MERVAVAVSNASTQPTVAVRLQLAQRRRLVDLKVPVQQPFVRCPFLIQERAARGHLLQRGLHVCLGQILQLSLGIRSRRPARIPKRDSFISNHAVNGRRCIVNLGGC